MLSSIRILKTCILCLNTTTFLPIDVFRGYDQELQRYVAVKKFKNMSDGNLGINMLIMREISFLRQLNHPNVIKSLDVLMGKKFDNILVIMVSL
jgi:serine/threonine protein kinase